MIGNEDDFMNRSVLCVVGRLDSVMIGGPYTTYLDRSLAIPLHTVTMLQMFQPSRAYSDIAHEIECPVTQGRGCNLYHLTCSVRFLGGAVFRMLILHM